MTGYFDWTPRGGPKLGAATARLLGRAMKEIGIRRSQSQRQVGDRFLLHPGAERQADPTPVAGWAGWGHLQRARALATYYVEARDQEAWDDDRLVQRTPPPEDAGRRSPGS